MKDGFFVAVVVHIDKAVRKPTIGLQGMAIDVAAWVVDGALQYVGGVECCGGIGVEQPGRDWGGMELLFGHLVVLGGLWGLGYLGGGSVGEPG